MGSVPKGRYGRLMATSNFAFDPVLARVNCAEIEAPDGH